MAGFRANAVGMRLTGAWDNFVRALRAAGRLDFRDLHAQLGELVTSATLEHFERQVGPGGKPWPRSKAAAGRDGRDAFGDEAQGKTLWKTGYLAGSITSKAHSDRADVGTNVPYAAIHQFGGKAGRGHAVKLPARPYLYVEGDPELEQDVVDTITDFLADTDLGQGGGGL